MERNGDYERVAEIRYSKLIDLDKKLNHTKKDLLKLQSQSKMIKEEVDFNEIAQVVAKWTGIPVTKILASETNKLINLETNLSKKIVGQSDAISL